MTTPRWAICLALGALALVWAPASAAAAASRVGVVVNVRVNAPQAEVDALAAALASGLRQVLAIDAVGGADARRRLPRALPHDCVARADCIDRVGRQLGADQLLFLIVVRIGPRVQVDATWADTRTGQTIPRGAVLLDDDGPPPVQVFAGVAGALLPEAAPRVVYEPAPPRRATARVWIAGGLGAAALAGSVGMALSARGELRRLAADGCGPAGCEPARVRAVERRQLAADALLGAAAIATTGALYMYLTSADGDRAPVRIGAAPGGAFVALGGRF